MKELICIAILLSSVIIAASCGEEEPAAIVESETTFTVDTLSAIDSIGVMAGDSNYVFGIITGVECLHDGEIAVLDGMTCRISVFDENGGFLFSFGGSGEGPGEFLNPTYMTVLADGRYIVFDRRAARMNIFSAEGQYLDYWSMGTLPACFSLDAVSDSSFVMYRHFISREEESLGVCYQVARFDLMSEMLTHELFSQLYTVPGGEEECANGMKVVTADPQGRVYISDIISDSYSIAVYSPEGDLLRSMKKDAATVPISEYAGGYMFPTMCIMFDDGEGEGGTFTGPEIKNLPFVSAMQVDAEGNLWARRGTTGDDIWDVFSPEGVLVREVHTAGFPEDESLVLHMNEHGMAATLFIPSVYARVYLLD